MCSQLPLEFIETLRSSQEAKFGPKGQKASWYDNLFSLNHVGQLKEVLLLNSLLP